MTYLFSSTAATVVDILVFTLLNAMLKGVEARQRLLISTVVARVISSYISFVVNRRLVFRAKDEVGNTAVRYFALNAAKLVFAYGGTYLLSGTFGVAVTPAKIVSDAMLGLISFKLQRESSTSEMLRMELNPHELEPRQRRMSRFSLLSSA